MTLYSALFYLLAAEIVVSTGLAITRRDLAHVVVYLVFSFFGTALLFYMLGAPFLAALEVIIYAGAIMILFLFIVMMIRTDDPREPLFRLRQWLPAAALGAVTLIAVTLLAFGDPESGKTLTLATVEPIRFGEFLFRKHWLAIEIASLLLLIAVIGALHLGKTDDDNAAEDPSL
jgi:NADH-quinone oxidoreductase subunit J